MKRCRQRSPLRGRFSYAPPPLEHKMQGKGVSFGNVKNGLGSPRTALHNTTHDSLEAAPTYVVIFSVQSVEG